MADLLFTITNRDANGASGTLSWSAKGLSSPAVSGPFGNGELPAGIYNAGRNKLLDKPVGSPYCDSGSHCWMQVLAPTFPTTRTDLGIHPDGGALGTEGCIGLRTANTKPWYDAFKAQTAGSQLTVEVS
jgi:hypothetical protein